jgi:hypothetical protein
MQRLIIVTNSAASAKTTSSVRDLITGFLQGKGWHVWHWFEDLWLVTVYADDVDFSQIRDEIQALLPERIHILLMEFKEDSYFTGSFPEAAIPWLKIHWGKKRGKKRTLEEPELPSTENP